MHFPIDLAIGHLDRVVEIDQLARFQKDSGAAGGDVVNDAGNAALHVDLDRHDIAALTLGKILFLKDLRISTRTQKVLKLIANLQFKIVRVMSEPTQLRRGRFADRSHPVRWRRPGLALRPRNRGPDTSAAAMLARAGASGACRSR